MSNTEGRSRIVHRAAARLAADGRWRDMGVTEAAAAVRDTAAGVDLGGRRRWELRHAAALTVICLHHLAPDGDWTLACDPCGPVEDTGICWRHTDGTVICDVVSVRGSDAAVWTARTRGHPRRLHRDLTNRHSDRFAGLRICVPAAPGNSLLVTSPTSPPVPLTGTRWWFTPPVGDHTTLAATLFTADEEGKGE